MAVKNTSAKTYTAPYEDICAVLRSPDFSLCMEAEFIEEAILSDGVEFRLRRKTDITRYGRNYFIKVKKTGENQAEVAATIQSRKVTVLLDTSWKKEAEKVFNFLNMLLRKAQ